MKIRTFEIGSAIVVDRFKRNHFPNKFPIVLSLVSFL